MDQAELLSFVATAFERQGIVYAVTGSHASIAYGENRFTNDIDVVAEINLKQLGDLLGEFPDTEFYTSQDGAKYAAVHGGQFNIIHQNSSQKVDVIVARDPTWPDQLGRRLSLPISERQHAWFLAPEDLMLKKMDAYREGGSDKHLRDIAGILKSSGVPVDLAYVNEWAGKLGLSDIWDAVLKAVGRTT